MSKSLAILSLFAGAYAQQIGTSTAETHPPLTFSQCTKSGCTATTNSVVLDANWRWVHNVGGYTNCYTGNTWNGDYCPATTAGQTSCANNCALDGADYSGTYGITTSGNALTLKFKTGSNVGSRVYLMDSSNSEYQLFKLKNQEFTFDVDVSQLPCGLNGALYFVSMDADGGMAKYPTNKSGAKYGTGYCDSQCPQDVKFINGLANTVGWTPESNSANSGTGSMGTCCTEMDIWEANSISTAYTPHPCTSTGQTVCNSNATCGVGSDRYSSICDHDGCDFNSYRMGNKTFFGPSSSNTINTNNKVTVVTQFITADGTATGTLSEIRRIYVQGGKVIQNSVSDVSGVSGNSITDSFCKAQKTAFGDTNSFAAAGGLSQMGKAMDDGMVLVMSLWDDYAVNMLWLDSDYPTTKDASSPGVARGSCSTSSGVPATVEAQSASAQVIYSNIKLGAFNTTYSTS